jgi:hypothetical protein
MAEYQVLYWREIPSMVIVRGEGREVQGRLPQRYQDAIDEAAMAGGATDGDAYLEGWTWGPTQPCGGTPEEILQGVLAELERSHPVATPGDAFQG